MAAAALFRRAAGCCSTGRSLAGEPRLTSSLAAAHDDEDDVKLQDAGRGSTLSKSAESELGASCSLRAHGVATVSTLDSIEGSSVGSSLQPDFSSASEASSPSSCGWSDAAAPSCPLLADALARVSSLPPLVSQHCADIAGIELVGLALLGMGSRGATEVFLEDALQYTRIAASPWHDFLGESVEQSMTYDMPLPPELPKAMARAFGLSDKVPGRATAHLGYVGDVLVMQSVGAGDGLPYADCVQGVSIHTFSAHREGGVQWNHWIIVEWLKPLPYTVRFIERMVEHGVKASANQTAVAFPKALRRVIAGHLEQ